MVGIGIFRGASSCFNSLRGSGIFTHPPLPFTVILVSQNYLGSINHTLLSIAILKQQNIPIKGLIFNGQQNISSEDFILNYTGLDCLGRVDFEEIIDKNVVKKWADKLAYLS